MRLSLFSFLLLASVAQADERVDINKADAVQIASALHGIGQKKAEKIVAWRNKYGVFGSIRDVAAVPEIGKDLADKNKKRIYFGSVKQAAKNSVGSADVKSAQEKGVLSLPVGAYSQNR